MGNVKRHFIKGRMNKSVDERLVPNGEYINALNVRLGSTEGSEVGSVENSKGNTKLTTLQYKGVDLSTAQCIGSFEDGVNETIYWFIHDGSHSTPVDMIVSYNTNTDLFIYHVVSTSVLNFNPTFLITGVNKVEDLLFFTDDINPPRKINVTRSYLEPTAGHVDQITEDDISVIKKPPRKAPTLQLIDAPGEENYLETNFVSFAYRYKYIDNEYSALSQFTDVAFESSPFNLDPDTNFNDGMLNRYNTAVVGVNTGGEDVVGIDICFKLGNDSDIRVMQKYIKEEAGWPDGIVQTVNFTNQQIYTLLPSSEILRLYDNVPLVAQAQTFMGNRLMYGNYEDGYDLTTATGARIDTNYTARLLSQNLSVSQNNGSTSTGVNYTIDTASTVTATDANAVIDFTGTGLSLVEGGVFGFSFTVTSQGFSGTWSPSSTIAHPTFTVSFVFNLPQNYTTVFEMVNSPDFIAQIGSNLSGSFQPVGSCSSGSAFTDIYNCALVAPSGYTLVNTGITAGSQGVFLSSNSATPNEFSLQILAAQYNNTTTTDNQNFEYFNVSNVAFTYQTESSNKSLHSNRDYEVGIVYMDKYKRATTTLTSFENTVFVPPVNSSAINRIRTTIPINMTAPSWADTYKFVLKQSRGTYDTIYSTTYYYDPSTTSYWFRLVGQDQALVDVGTELIVKTDGNGAVSDELKVTVLDKVSQPTNFLHLLQNSTDILEVPGLYIRLRAQDFSVDTSVQNICYSQVKAKATDSTSVSLGATQTENYYQGQAIVNYPLFVNTSSGFSQIPVPSGSVVRVKIKFRRNNVGLLCPGNNGAEFCRVTKTFTASQPYSNIQEFWEGEGLNSIIPSSMDCNVNCQDDSGENSNVVLAPISSPISSGSTSTLRPLVEGQNQMFFYEINDSTVSSERRLYLRCVNGSRAVSGLAGEPSVTTVEFCIQEPGSLVAFETVPNEIADGVFFEGSENYDVIGGYHQGNVTNQDATTEGVVELDFFNCYSFGNGVESYKIEDSSIGQSFALGERTILVSAQDFKRADRFADITYSGVYNDESNVNKLNEFNLGLLNFKALEDIYGPIQKMVARETDILVLQEDRISYVLANKNAVTDAEGGNILTAAPLILGQQVARVEEYGISANPESYAEFGMDKYFTDSKRGAVIQLRGSSFSNEQLSVISQSGMRGYFRDLFNSKFNTQKLGGYDPYMDEYVVSSNENKLPVETACVNCDISQTINLAAAGDTSEFCVNLGGVVGDVVIEWNTPALGPGVGITTFSINANYNGTDYPSGNITTAGTLTISKDSVNPNTVAIVVTANGGSVTNLNFTVNCPVGNELKIVQVALNLDWQATQTIHNEFRFVDGTTQSNTYNQGVIFGAGATPVVSQYQLLTGLQGTTIFPPNGSTVYVQVRKQSGDTFNYDPTAASSNKLMYLRSSTLYGNNPTDIAALLAAASSNALTVTPNTLGSLLYTGDFIMPNNTNEYLYLIYDYRLAESADLCAGASAASACCSCGALTTFYLDAANLSLATTVYSDESLNTPAANQFYSQLVNGNSIVREQVAGLLSPTTSCASCNRKCTEPEAVPAPASSALRPNTAYDITYDLAAGVGVVPIRFTPGASTGIFVTYDSVTTSVSSATTLTDGGNPNSSYFAGPYYGDDTTCNPSPGTSVRPIYEWDEITADFVNSNTTESITIQASDLTSLTTGAAGSYVLYVSKTSATPSTMDVRIVSPCASGVPNWSVDVDCPRILTGFASSIKSNTDVNICTLAIDSTLYNLPVLTPNAFGIPAVRDWVFKDNLGEDVADDGYYKLSGGALGCTYIRVVNGVIVTKVN